MTEIYQCFLPDLTELCIDNVAKQLAVNWNGDDVPPSAQTFRRMAIEKINEMDNITLLQLIQDSAVRRVR